MPWHVGDQAQAATPCRRARAWLGGGLRVGRGRAVLRFPRGLCGCALLRFHHEPGRALRRPPSRWR
eukprot:3730656-Alexandrium_andersonii.AAC.1